MQGKCITAMAGQLRSVFQTAFLHLLIAFCRLNPATSVRKSVVKKIPLTFSLQPHIRFVEIMAPLGLPNYQIRAISVSKVAVNQAFWMWTQVTRTVEIFQI